MKLGLLLLFLLLLSACRPTSQQAFDDYLTRLERTLEHERPSLPQQRPSIGQDRDWHASTTELRLGVFEAWGFRRCQLTELMGERNSALGRVFSASQQYLYEMRLLFALERCLGLLEDQPELLARTHEILAIKQQDSQAFLFNATLGGPEFRAFISYSQPQWQLERPASGTQIEAILQHWLALQQQPQQLLESASFEAQLQQLRQLGQGGGWVKSLVAANQGLAQAIALLEQAEAEAFCAAGRHQARIEVAENVLYRVFAGKLQHHLSDLSRFGQLYVPLLVELSANWQDLSPAAWQYAQQVEHSFEQFMQLNRQHSKAWQALLLSCGRPVPGG